MSVELQEVSVRESLEQAITEVEEKENGNEGVDEGRQNSDTEGSASGLEKHGRERDESGKFTKQAKEKNEQKEEKTTEALQAQQPQELKVPQSLPATLKDKYGLTPQEVREWIEKRELDNHQMFTRHDGELNLGRQMKEAITPYMAIIQAEGGTPVAAVQSLLNTAYQLRTAPPAQKAQLIQQIAQQYGVDLGQIQNQPQIDPAMQQIMDKISGLENKFTQQSTLQQNEENARIQSEVNAFGADPRNKHFSDLQVKAAMAPLLGNGQAKDLQEAYDMACWAIPHIRSEMIASQTQEQQEKRTAEIAKKKQASAQVTGSPGKTVPQNSTQEKSLRESLEEAYDELTSSRI